MRNNSNNNFLGDSAAPRYCDQSEAESHSKTSLINLDIGGPVQDIGKAARQKAVVTGPLISAVLVAILLYLLVGYDTKGSKKQEGRKLSMMQMNPACPCFTSPFFFLLVRIISGGGEGGGVYYYCSVLFFH